MVDLRTTYLGIDLKNPLIVGACSLTGTAKSARQIEEAGAGALVIRSLFEEQIQLERLVFDEDLLKYDNRYAEMLHFYPPLEHAGPDEHMEDVRQIRQAVHIPLLASLNAVSRDTWVQYAQRLEALGVNALELNFYASPSNPGTNGASIEEEQIATLAEIRKTVHIPIAVKLSPFYTNPLNVIRRLDDVGVNGFVLFNRLFQPEIDIDKEAHVSPLNLSRAEDSRLPLRFTGLLHGQIKADVCSSTGILSGGQIVEMILAGAAAIQTVSSLYQNGLPHIAALLRDVEIWMEAKGYAGLGDFRGKLDQQHCNNPWVYTRAQYANLLMHPDEIVKNAPVP